MADVTRAAAAFGRWFVGALILAGAIVVVRTRSDEATLSGRVQLAQSNAAEAASQARSAAEAAKKAESDLEMEKLRNIAAHASSFADRTAYKAKTASEVAGLNAVIAENRAEIRRLTGEVRSLRSELDAMKSGREK